jgi:hypothetical protein
MHDISAIDMVDVLREAQRRPGARVSVRPRGRASGSLALIVGGAVTGALYAFTTLAGLV